MSKQAINEDTWTEIHTTTVDTVFQAHGGDMWLSTQTSHGGSYLMRNLEGVVVSSGLTVYAKAAQYPTGNPAKAVHYMPLGT